MSYRPKISKEALQRILAYRKREEAESKRRFDILFKTSKVASWVLILFNVLLIPDVHFFSTKTTQDTIKDSFITRSTRSRYGNSSRGQFKIETFKGNVWAVRNTGYETSGCELTYQSSRMFGIVKNIYNHKYKYRIYRTYDAFTMAKWFSILLLILGLTGVLFTKIHSLAYGFIAIFMIAFAAIEGILLIF